MLSLWTGPASRSVFYAQDSRAHLLKISPDACLGTAGTWVWRPSIMALALRSIFDADRHGCLDPCSRCGMLLGPYPGSENRTFGYYNDPPGAWNSSACRLLSTCFSPMRMQPRRLTQWCAFMRKIEAGNALPLRAIRHRRNSGFLATRAWGKLSFRSRAATKAIRRLSLSAVTMRKSDTETGRLHLKSRQQAQAGCLLAQLVAQLHACDQEAEHCRYLESYTRSTVPGRDLHRSLGR